MEVSSHAVDFHRVVGVDYHAAVWTNLSQDHLDWHKTMENYRNAKLRWLASLDPKRHVALNIDDPSAHYFIEGVRAQKVLYGLNNKADVTARNCRLSGDGTQFTLVTPKGEIEVNAKLRGEFNVYNMLAAVAVVLNFPLTLDDIKRGLEKNIAVAGRFQPIALGQPFSVIIDYAHTPGGMETVLRAARAMKPKRLISVFGCGGDRDRAKRPQMAAAVEANSDLFIITDDNPRTEDPDQITSDILSGLKKKQSSACQIVHDRREAIKRALDMGQPGDLVLVVGKGHESTQIFKDHTIHFNDCEVAEELLRNKGYSG
jgi:UDP-N-acetylmuramyl-tripeptide synthetase